MNKTHRDLILARDRILEEKSILTNLISPEAFENKKIKLAKKNEAVYHLTQSLVEVQDIYKDTLEDNEDLGRTETAIQMDMERLKDKVNQSVTEVNHMKIRIKDKKIDEERQVSVLDMKLAKIQELCNGESRDLLEKLKVRMETVQKEVEVTLTRQTIHLNKILQL